MPKTSMFFILIIGSIIISCVRTAPPSDFKTLKSSIIGGELVKKGEFPGVISLTMEVTYEGVETKDYFCTGTVISKTEIMTAGHCVFWEEMEVAKSKEEFTKVIKIYMGLGSKKDYVGQFSVKEIHVHPYFKENTWHTNDFGYLVLDKELPINDEDVFQLPKSYSEYTDIVIRAKHGQGLVVGYGRSLTEEGGVKKKVLLDLRGYIKDGLEEYIFAGNPATKSAWHGDSGGPMFLKDKNDKWRPMGVVHGPRGDGGQYNTVNKFIIWVYTIKAQVELDLGNVEKALEYTLYADDFVTDEVNEGLITLKKTLVTE